MTLSLENKVLYVCGQGKACLSPYFISSLLPSPPPCASSVSIQSLQRQLAEAKKESIRRLSMVQSNYHKLVSVCMELVAALEGAVAGQMVG